MGFSGNHCPECSGSVQRSTAFCPHCGAPASPASDACSSCGAEVKPTSSFCGNCGTLVRAPAKSLGRGELALGEVPFIAASTPAPHPIQKPEVGMFPAEQNAADLEQRAALNERIRETLNRDRMGQFASSKDLEEFIRQTEHELGMKEVVRQSEMDELKRSFDLKQQDLQIARSHLLETLELEHRLAVLRNQQSLTEMQLDHDVRLEREALKARQDADWDSFQHQLRKREAAREHSLKDTKTKAEAARLKMGLAADSLALRNRKAEYEDVAEIQLRPAFDHRTDPLSLDRVLLGSEVVVEIETNRPMVHGHALMLRLRVTSNLRSRCGVTVRMRLHGHGRHIEQDDSDLEQRCELHSRGDQHIFSFPFLSLRPGNIVVQELRVGLTSIENAGEQLSYALPDKSLFVHVSDPAQAAVSPGVVISGGIHVDFSKLKEVYGSDIGSLLNLHAPREVESGRQEIGWQPIGLRVVQSRPLPQELRLSLPGSIALDLVKIRAGEFTMGSPDDRGKDDERPAHRVRIGRDFFLGKFPVTQQQFQAVSGRNPSRFTLTKHHPVENVSWDEAREFCRRLKAHLLVESAWADSTPVEVAAVGLPTEAEWEYACRAGTQALFSFGDDLAALRDHGWFDKNSDRTTQAVGQLGPNAWGLFDMHGNVWEWCDDFYHEDYAGSSSDDPQGPATGDRRVLRGGSWSCYSKQCRSACRHAAELLAKTANYGFRVVVRTKTGFL
jgi:formylglycine-generating enzyme required for sulfatase activity